MTSASRTLLISSPRFIHYRYLCTSFTRAGFRAANTLVQHCPPETRPSHREMGIISVFERVVVSISSKKVRGPAPVLSLPADHDRRGPLKCPRSRSFALRKFWRRVRRRKWLRACPSESSSGPSRRSTCRKSGWLNASSVQTTSSCTSRPVRMPANRKARAQRRSGTMRPRERRKQLEAAAAAVAAAAVVVTAVVSVEAVVACQACRPVCSWRLRRGLLTAPSISVAAAASTTMRATVSR